MPHAYTEDQLVEQPAMRLFAELGWQLAGPHTNADVAGTWNWTRALDPYLTHA